MAKDTMMSAECGQRFGAYMVALRKAHEVFLKENNGAPDALFHAVRMHMIAAAAYLSRNIANEIDDEELRTVLHGLLELAVNDYQHNERMYVGSKGAS